MPRLWASPEMRSHSAGTGLVGADPGAQAFVEDLGAAAGHHDQAGFLEALQHFEGGAAFHLGEVGDLHRGEGLDEQVGIELARGAQGVQEPLERTGGMAAAHDVQLVQMQGRGVSGAQTLQHFLGAQAEGPLVFFAVAAERAEHAAVDADIGIIYLAVDHIRGLVPVHAATRVVGQSAHGGDIGAGEKRHARLRRSGAGRQGPCPERRQARGLRNRKHPA